jgi:hypothetical protein
MEVPYKVFADGPSADDSYVLESLATLFDAVPPGPRETFASFATRTLGGTDAYVRFVHAVGFSDFEAADATDALQNYGFDDLVHGGGARFAFDWNLLSARLERALRARGVEVHKSVKATALLDGGIRTANGKRYMGRVVLAVPAHVVRELAPEHPAGHAVAAQPFVLVYARVTSWSGGAPPAGFMVVRPPLQKIAPVDPERGVYLVAYADNESAQEVMKHAKDPAFFATQLQHALGHSTPCTIDALRVYHHVGGTHYLLPGGAEAAAVQTHGNVTVVGEAFGAHRGWSEGALQSVERWTSLGTYTRSHPE